MNWFNRRQRTVMALVLLTGGVLTSSPSVQATLQQGSIERVSVSSNGIQGNDGSDDPSISSNGRFVAFESEASNLVAGDSNDMMDVFVHDRIIGSTILVSVASDGRPSSGPSGNPSISADGRLVAFDSFASNLVEEDTNGYEDVFVHDLMSGKTTRVSVASDGTQSNGMSFNAAISANGRYVTFGSFALNLAPGGSSGVGQIYVHDRLTGVTEMASITSDGVPGTRGGFHPAISGEGRWVSFTSDSDDFVEGDINYNYDIFVHDRLTGETEIVSVASDGTYGNSISFGSSISIDGRFVTFESWSSNLVGGDMNGNFDIFMHDRWTGETIRVSVASDGTEGNSASVASSVAANGGFVAYDSISSNLVAGDTNETFDVFVYGRLLRETWRVSFAADGTEGNDESSNPVISADGASIAFKSLASNLVAGDTNGQSDIFVTNREGTSPVMILTLPVVVK